MTPEVFLAQIRTLKERIRYFRDMDLEGILSRSGPGTSLADPARVSLQVVQEDLGDCQRCKLHHCRTRIVFGAGNPRADLVFIGEAPGREEDRQGQPFVGAAGQLLTRMIQAMGLSRQQVYITNIIKCRPPENRNPEEDEIASCEPFLRNQLKAIQPLIICTLGKFAAQTLLRTRTTISRLRGQFHDFENIQVMPTFHPAYLLRNPQDKKLVWEDLQMILARMKEIQNNRPPVNSHRQGEKQVREL